VIVLHAVQLVISTTSARCAGLGPAGGAMLLIADTLARASRRAGTRRSAGHRADRRQCS
jgi:hypothetical protein